MSRQERESLSSLLHEARKTVQTFEPVVGNEADHMKQVVERAIMTAALSPSQGNFQPTRCHIVTRHEEKQLLLRPCFYSSYISSSSGIIVILADKKNIHMYIQMILEEDRAQGAITEKEMKALKLFYEMGFLSSPFGIGGALKRLFLPFLRLFFTLPEVPLENYKSWFVKQAGLFTSTLLLELSLGKVDWVILDHFDEKRVLKALSYASSEYYLPFVVAYGKAKERADTERVCLDSSIITL